MAFAPIARCGKCHGSIQTAPAPERIKEGSSFSDEISNWYLWGFSNSKTSLFEYHDTRSGDVASKLLNSSKCEYLISDVFSGYGKAVRDSNVRRQEGGGRPLIQNVYCHAHARRKFKKAEGKPHDDKIEI